MAVVVAVAALAGGISGGEWQRHWRATLAVVVEVAALAVVVAVAALEVESGSDVDWRRW
jgi:hypothetical protein